MKLCPCTLDLWHLAVHLDDDLASGPCDFARIVIPGTQAEIAMSIHGRHSHNQCINSNMLSEKARSLMKGARYVVDDLATILLPSLDQCAFHGRDKHAIRADTVIELIAQYGV